MKKYAAIISVAAVILIPTLLFFTMCLPLNQSTVTALNGELDLRPEDFGDHVYALKGNWRIVYGELLPPSDPMEEAESIQVPSLWSEQGYPHLGAATHRLTVYVADDHTPYMLMMNSVSSAYVMWVNGERLYETGTVSADAADSEALYSNALIPVHAKDGVLDIVLHVSNHEFYSGGISGMVFFGEADAVQRYFIRTRVMSAMALGCILMTAFYHLLLYLFRRREKAYILFSMLCFLCFVRFVFESDGLNQYFQIVQKGSLDMRLYMTLLALHSVAIALFALYIFSRDLIVRYKVHAAVCMTALGLIFWFMPINKPYSEMLATILLLAVMLFTIVRAAMSPVLRENPWTRLYFISLFLFLCMGLTKLSGSYYLYMPGLVSNLFMILTQSLLLSQQYTRAFALVEETNANLEQLVADRTRSLQTANEAMLATNIAMKELVSNISHDLKTPLAVMSVNLETLSALAVTQSDADYQRHVRTAYQKNRDLQRLIQNLFEVSRIEASRNLYSPEWESMHRLLAQAAEKYDTFLEDHNLLLDITVEDDMEISLDPQKIWSVFDNIIYNAVCYTERGGSITITAHNMESAATITIHDTGCGIAPEHLPHIFERFYRGSQARSTKEGESGLGLYIVKNIMEGCGGTVEIQSEPDKGTAVILTFPGRIIDQTADLSHDVITKKNFLM